MLAGPAFFDRRHRRVVIFVAGAGAVAQLGHGVGRIAELLVRTGLIVVGVAGRAVRGVAGILVWNRLRVGLVTVDAIKRLRMRSRVASRLVRVIQHR